MVLDQLIATTAAKGKFVYRMDAMQHRSHNNIFTWCWARIRWLRDTLDNKGHQFLSTEVHKQWCCTVEALELRVYSESLHLFVQQ